MGAFKPRRIGQPEEPTMATWNQPDVDALVDRLHRDHPDLTIVGHAALPLEERAGPHLRPAHHQQPRPGVANTPSTSDQTALSIFAQIDT